MTVDEATVGEATVPSSYLPSFHLPSFHLPSFHLPSPYLPSQLPSRERLPIRIEEPDLAEIQLPNSSFDLGPIPDDHPNEVVGTDRLLRRCGCISDRQRPNAFGIAVVVPIVEPEGDELLDESLHRVHRLPVP